MRIRTETVTPKRAQEWLDRSHDVQQRSLSARRVERLVHAILDDQWVLTHQAIALDPDGRVLDGQHRLQAIVNAGQIDPDVECEVLVAWESDPATFGVIDTGAARTTADSLKIAGYTNTNVLAACIRSTLTYDQVKGTTSDWRKVTARLTTADVMEFLEDESNERKAVAAMQLGARVSTAVGRHGLNTAISSSALICHRSKVGLGADTMAEFYERLSDGAMLQSHSPILALRRWMIGDTGFSRVPHSYRRPYAIAAILKGINDYRLGRERNLIIFRIGTEPMPVLLTKKQVDDHYAAVEKGLADQEEAEEAADAAAEVEAAS